MRRVLVPLDRSRLATKILPDARRSRHRLGLEARSLGGHSRSGHHVPVRAALLVLVGPGNQLLA